MYRIRKSMYQINYQFLPGDTVYAITYNLELISGTIQQFEADVYPNDDDIVNRLQYLILSNSTTFELPSDRIFTTMDDALYFLSLQLGASPTPTPSRF